MEVVNCLSMNCWRCEMNNEILKLVMKITGLKVNLKYKNDKDEETELKRLDDYYLELDRLLKGKMGEAE